MCTNEWKQPQKIPAPRKLWKPKGFEKLNSVNKNGRNICIYLISKNWKGRVQQQNNHKLLIKALNSILKTYTHRKKTRYSSGTAKKEDEITFKMQRKEPFRLGWRERSAWKKIRTKEMVTTGLELRQNLFFLKMEQSISWPKWCETICWQD